MGKISPTQKSMLASFLICFLASLLLKLLPGMLAFLQEMKLLWFLHRWTNYNVVCHIVSFSCCQGKILSFHLLQVNYVGKAANIYDTGYQLNGSAYVISKYISNTWLWDRVRVSGGAYGGFCDFDTHSGTIMRCSARYGIPITVFGTGKEF